MPQKEMRMNSPARPSKKKPLIIGAVALVVIAVVVVQFIIFTRTSPAVFKVTNLVIEPAQAQPGEEIIIKVTAANTGGREGNYTAELKINNVIKDTQTVTLAAKDGFMFNFKVSDNIAGTYAVKIGGLSGQFVITGTPAAKTPAATLPSDLTTTATRPTTLTTNTTTTTTSTTTAATCPREWVITDADVSRLFTQISSVSLVAHFIPGNMANFTLAGLFSGTINIGIMDGKLCEFPVDQIIYDLFPGIKDYIFFIDGTAYLSYTWFDPAGEIAPDVTEMPVMVSVTTEDGQAIVTYEWPPNP